MIKVELKPGIQIIQQIIEAAKSANIQSAKEIEFILVSADVQVALLTDKVGFTTFDLRIQPDGKIMYLGIQLITSSDLPSDTCYLLT